MHHTPRTPNPPLHAPLRTRLRALATAVLVFVPAMQAAGQGDWSLSPQRWDETRRFAYFMKTLIAEFYVAQMRYPASLHEIGDPAPPTTVEHVRVGLAGVLELDLAARDLGGHRVYLRPHLDGGRLHWECISPDIQAIATLMANCRFVPGFVPVAPSPAIEAQSRPLPQTSAPARVEAPPLQPLWQGLYRGTVGGLPIVAQFWQSEQTTSTTRDPKVPVEGLYYYRRHARSLSLLPTAERDTLLECPERSSGATPCEQPTGIWAVEVTEKRVTGTWRASADAPPKNVELARRVTAKRLAHDLYYDFLREDARRSVAIDARNHGIVWRTERRDSAPMP